MSGWVKQFDSIVDENGYVLIRGHNHMIIVYESKTGFTKRYAKLLAVRTGFKSYSTKEALKRNTKEDIIFMGWMKVGKVQGLNKLRDYKIKAVCGSGTGRTAEPDEEAVITRNKLENTPLFYMRGGCYPLKSLKGFDRIMMTMFVGMLKKRDDKDERIIEAIGIIENGFDGVKEENLVPLIEWMGSTQ